MNDYKWNKIKDRQIHGFPIDDKAIRDIETECSAHQYLVQKSKSSEKSIDQLENQIKELTEKVRTLEHELEKAYNGSF